MGKGFWTEEKDAELRHGWTAGWSQSVIAEWLGTTKNAIAGRVSRLGLERRASPIGFDKPAKARVVKPPRAPTVTLPPAPAPAQETFTTPIISVVAPPPKPTAPPRPERVLTCCWPIGNPGTKDFRFCDTHISSHGPYCEEHANRAYVRRKVAA